MSNRSAYKKTIALPIAIHDRASELAKKLGIKQYELVTAAILLAETDEALQQAILNTHAKRFSLATLDIEVKKKLEGLSIKELDALLAHLKKS